MPPKTTAGPSRRSHTKSRKGCKTCKRRHIRCDEAFPQCRNCTKHQVQCDYHDSAPAEAGPPPPPQSLSESPAPVAGLFYSPEIESILKHWQRSGEAALGDGNASIDLRANDHSYSLSDLHLLYYALSSIQNCETNKFAITTSIMPIFFQIASSHPFAVHAILAITAGELAWETSSNESKNLAYHHGGVALRGLQEAMTAFSRVNAEAILCASILLSWQANDWRSWTSLMQGFRTVSRSFRSWGMTSKLINPFVEQYWAFRDPFPAQARTQDEGFRRFYGASLQHVDRAVVGLVPHLLGRADEIKWVEQLQDYLHRLLRIEPASTPEEQFNHLYTFRKWLLWVPPLLLKTGDPDPWTLLVVAYFYATALRLEPLFPEVGNELIALTVIPPLNNTIHFLQTSQLQPSYQYQPSGEWVHLLSYPQESLGSYHASHTASATPDASFGGVHVGLDDIFSDIDMSTETFGLRNQYSTSPGFPPSFTARGSIDSDSMHSSDWSAVPANQGSPFLGIPPAASDGTFYGSSMNIPGLQHRVSVDETYEMMRRSVDFRGGFVDFAPKIWA